MSMVEQFFSVEYAGNENFQGLEIWKEDGYRKMQGTYPVISLSLSSVKEKSYEEARKKICSLIRMLYQKNSFLLEGDWLNGQEKAEFRQVSAAMPEYEASLTIRKLSGYLKRYYGKNVILLMDEYDTPMQEAHVKGYWQELADFMRNLLNAALKDNPYLDRGIMTGITRISKESIFSDLNHLQVVTTTSDKYADCFGFTEEEVFAALEEYGLGDRKAEVKKWYDGFCFGKRKDIYNPWFVLNYLDKREAGPYWDQIYELSVTNFEVMIMLKKLVRGWFAPSSASYNEFIRALLQDDIQAMNVYMNRIAQATFSYFDSGKPENIERN